MGSAVVASGFDLASPFAADTLLEVRTSRMKQMAGLQIESGIDKELCTMPMRISSLGLDGDEHDPTFHGGVDKAILGYCSSHYPEWQSEFPEAAERFTPGGFGENFVTKHMNERNVCIGDVMAVGDEVLLQVSLPRQPCFKLNHRFQLKNFAPNTYKSSRTGWYYRVLREGTVKAGDQIKLVERRWPKWTIERVQEYLHRNQDDLAMNEELSDIEALGDESRNAFKRRVAKAKATAKRAGKPAEQWKDFRIHSKIAETPRIASFILEAVSHDAEAEPLEEGAHAKLMLPNGLVRTYSVVSGDRNKFELGIALDDASRGGSEYLHRSAKIGDVIQVGRLTADTKPARMASNHVFIAGGIGITAFLALIEVYEDIHWNYELHYAVRSADEVPFKNRLEKFGSKVIIYDKSQRQRMDVQALLGGLKWNSHVYVCGPSRMMEAVRTTAEELGLGEKEIQYEAFAADIGGDPFEVEVLNKGNKVLAVGEDESLLEVLKKEFGDVPSSCEVGNCGTCKVTLKAGKVDHRGTALLTEEKSTTMLSCVSRGIGRIAIEI